MSAEIIASTENSNRTMIDILTSHVRLWLLAVSFLMLLGLAIILGPKYPPGPIHISVARGHGITTQDVIALFPISISIIWFGAGIWKHRDSWMNTIRRSPIKAFFIALILGIFLGLLFGFPIGAIYRIHAREFMARMTALFGA
jgi:hypothetical protein